MDRVHPRVPLLKSPPGKRRRCRRELSSRDERPCAPGVRRCSNFVLRCAPEVLPSTVEALRSTNSVVQCTTRVLQSTNFVLRCAPTVVPSTNSVVRSTSAVLPRANFVIRNNPTVVRSANFVLRCASEALGITDSAQRPQGISRKRPSSGRLQRQRLYLRARAVQAFHFSATRSDDAAHATIARVTG